MRRTIALLSAALLLAACSHDPAAVLPGGRHLGVAGDTVVGIGSLVELRAWRAEWVETRAGRDYRYTVRTSCFCPPEMRLPTRVTVSGDRVVSVTREEGEPPAYAPAYTTIEEIYDGAIRARQRGQAVHRAVYHEDGHPATLSFGPWEVDGGVEYRVSDVVFLP